MEDKLIPVMQLGNNQVDDMLEELGMITEDGNCPYTVSEIFKEGIYYAFNSMNRWLKEKINSGNLPISYGKVFENYVSEMGVLLEDDMSSLTLTGTNV